MREYKIHHVGEGLRTRCCTRSARAKTTGAGDDVTCNRCLYLMFVSSELRTGDRRITDNMRKHHAAMITRAKQRDAY